MPKEVKVKASSEPPLPVDYQHAELRRLASATEVEKPARVPLRPLQKPGVRNKASAEQATLQSKGANSLPVSDYPLKEGPTAANSVDARERSQVGNRAKSRVRAGSDS